MSPSDRRVDRIALAVAMRVTPMVIGRCRPAGPVRVPQSEKEPTMRNILALVGAATVAFLLVGWYLGWYQVSSTTTSQGPQSVQVDINPNKITQDVKTGVEKGEKVVES